MTLGLASATVLAVGGGLLAWVQPGLRDARLTDAGREVFAAVGRAILDGALPAQEVARKAAMAGLLERIDALTAGLPGHAQGELSQLLAVLAAGAGRRMLAGLEVPWPSASVSELQGALQSMRVSSLAVRQQAYQALHDIVNGAYFSDAGTWGLLGYPGPTQVS